MASDRPRSTENDPDRIVAEARKSRELREQGYREQAFKLFPPVCGRCGRGFEGKKLKELTVHHKNHNHNDNPPDGSNWELLCVYCHDNEHQKLQLEGTKEPDSERGSPATHQPFAGLADLLKKRSP